MSGANSGDIADDAALTASLDQVAKPLYRADDLMINSPGRPELVL